MIRYLILLFVLALAGGINAQKVSDFKGETYGDGIQSARYIEYNDLLKKLNKADTVEATVHAVVSEVCQVKGCWMTLGEGADAREVMVRFKDYGFFVPKDIGGRKVLIEGQAFSTVIPVDELRHYAEDAGKSQEEIEAITEPETKLAFTATGVLVIAD